MESNINEISYGTCRFCLSKGNHRDIMKEYEWRGIREVYYDLFQECFNLYLCTNTARTSLICTMCVQKLRDASVFRAMVVDSEKQLINTLDVNELIFVNMSKAHNEMDIKVEEESEMKEEHNTLNTKQDDNDYLNNDIDAYSGCTSESNDELVEGEAELLGRFTSDILKPLPSRDSLKYTCKQYFNHLEFLKGKNITPKSIKKLIDPSPRRMNSKVYITEKLAHIINISTILENSNLTPFKTRRRTGYPCFYCSRICESIDQLHEHSEKDHTRENVKKLLGKHSSESLAVYVLVSQIKCTICDEKVPNLNDLKTHLTRVHKKKLYPEYGDRIVPFKVSKANEYVCQICGFNFETFGAVERHMNVHFRNYVCDQCGAGYVTKNRLKVHLKCTHVSGAFPCEICKKVYATHTKYKSHLDAVHRMVKKNKCPKCPARFADYFDRHKHMVDVHGDPPLRYRCNVCDALFKRRYALSCHMKRRHLEVKDVQCTLCAYKCYTTPELKAHMVKHNGERTNECLVCKKSYARKKTLKEHMRIHNNDRRYVCVVCGQAFVQNCSLKGHMKAHHTDYVNTLTS